MALETLHGFFDASGKLSGGRDKLITVNGCLGTASKWDEFRDEWQASLKQFGFAPHPKTKRYVFHTTDFHAGYCKLSPGGLTKSQRVAIYRKLVPIVRKHSLFIVGYAVSLDSFAKFAGEFPMIAKYRFGKPGTFVSVLTVGKAMEWAGRKGYSQSIKLTFDQGDEFWGEMSNDFRAFTKTPVNEHLTIESLRSGDKAEFSQLQAADVVAWECRQYFRRLVDLKILVAGRKIRPEFEMLRHPDSFFTLYEYDDLKRRAYDIYPEANGDIASVEAELKRSVEVLETKHRFEKERRLTEPRRQ